MAKKRSIGEVRQALSEIGVEGSIFPIQQVNEPEQKLIVCSRLSYEKTMLSMTRVIKKLWDDVPKRIEVIFGEPTEYIFPEFTYTD